MVFRDVNGFADKKRGLARPVPTRAYARRSWEAGVRDSCSKLIETMSKGYRAFRWALSKPCSLAIFRSVAATSRTTETWLWLRSRSRGQAGSHFWQVSFLAQASVAIDALDQVYRQLVWALAGRIYELAKA